MESNRVTPRSSPSASLPRLRLRLTAAAERAVRDGHPWVFADSVREQNRDGLPGELGVVYDKRDRFLALGLFDPASPIRLRVLHTGKPVPLDRTWWQARLDASLARRAHLFDNNTTGYRLIHGENDGWPALVLDRYGATLVLKLYTGAWLPRLADVMELLARSLRPERLVLRLSRNIQAVAAEGFGVVEGPWPGIALEEPHRRNGIHTQSDSAEADRAANPSGDSMPSESGNAHAARAAVGVAPAACAPPGQPRDCSSPDAPFALFLESGIRFEAEVIRGQKTGFYLDQRENRRLVETLARGAEVLNAFSFSGGFSLYAARGGAASVTDLDISSHALESARRNFALNAALPPVAQCHHETVQAETFEWLAQSRRSFDLIILDPPSLARREAERAGAIRAYARLAALGLTRLRPDGMLVAASCSAHVAADEFFAAVRGAARQSGRRFVEQQTTAHPPDHPATFPEAHYLKCIYLRMGD